MGNTRRRVCAALFLLLVAQAASAIDPDLLAGLKARAIGPAAVGGRITAIDVERTDTRRIVIGTATGGVWKSVNAGLTWTPIFDDQPYASIGAVALDPANPEVIWVGTGEGNVRNSTSVGGGMFRSRDGGRSWDAVGLAGTERINRIAIDPRDSQIVYAAALGTLWGENADRGLYRTRDGGKNWERVLYVDARTGATDVKIDPHNPDRIYAALWQFRRWPYHFKSGGPGSGMYISEDGGATWEQRTEEDGLPKGEHGRMVFAPSPAQPGLVYALVEAKKSALLKSTDSGRTWDAVNTESDVADRPFYYTELAADPKHPERLYNIATRLRVSIDGGKTFTTNDVIDCCAAGNTIHIDNHAFWINPDDPEHLIVGNDGGIAISRDRGVTWRFVRNLPLAQFYHVAVDDDVPYHVYGGLQDNGSWRGPSEVWENGEIRNLHWQEVGFGDGFDTRPDPRNSLEGYAMSQGGYLTRWNLATGERRAIFPARPADTDLRFNWSAALAIDPEDPDVIYYGSQFVHRSPDRGLTWELISPDLTSDNPDWQTFIESGGLTPDVTAAENYTTIVTLAVSNLDPKVIWAGTDDGRVHVTRDGGERWQRIDERARGARGAWVPMITASPHDAGTAFVVFDDHRRSDMTTYAYRVSNYGANWARFEDDDLRGYALSILQDHEDPDLLFLGTELGLFFSSDGGDAWHPLRALPTVSVMDMAIQARENDLVLGTHGRAIHIIDDYRALRGLDQADFATRLAILSATPGQQYDPLQTPSTRFTGSGEYRGPNEPYGVMVTFMASGDDLTHPEPAKDRARRMEQRRGQTLVQGEAGEESTAEDDNQDDEAVKVELRVETLDGELVRRHKYPVHQGINRLNWNLSSEGVRPPPSPDRKELKDGLPDGPEVPPGTYRLTLTLGEASASTEVDVAADPRSAYPAAARVAQYQAARSALALRARAVDAIESIVHARDDVKTALALIKRLGDQGGETAKALKEQAESVARSITELEKRFRVPPDTKGIVYDDDKVLNRIGTAQAYVGSSRDAPSQTARRALEIAEKTLAEAEAAWQTYREGELAALRDALREAGVGLLSTDS